MASGSLLHWCLDDLHVSVAPSSSGQPHCLDVGVTRPSTGEREIMLWDATAPWALVSRAAEAPAPLMVLPTFRERDLLITAEQGLGDFIQQWRYVLPLAERFRRVRIQCRPELHRLLQQQALPVELVSPGETRMTAADIRVSLMRLDTLCPDPTGGGAYLTAASSGHRDGRLRVGLNWAANARGAANDIKSVPLALLERVVRNRSDIAWISVQWGGEELGLARQPWSADVERMGGMISDVADLAAAVAGLDLLISVDSAPAHLAGALGVPVWTLLSQPCSWRWGLDSATTPLYRAMRLIRQTTPGDWIGAMDAMNRMLDEVRHRPRVATAPLPPSAPVMPGSPGGMGFRPGSVQETVLLCGGKADLRAAFVSHPLKLLERLGVSVGSHDHRSLAAVFKAMVDFHGGFSWCTPLPAPGFSPQFASAVGDPPV